MNNPKQFAGTYGALSNLEASHRMDSTPGFSSFASKFWCLLHHVFNDSTGVVKHYAGIQFLGDYDAIH